MITKVPIVLDFRQIGQLFVPPGPNMPMPIPDCASLQVLYEPAPSANNPNVMDLKAFMRFGDQSCQVTDVDNNGATRALKFRLRVRHATLEILQMENVKIKPSTVHGFGADGKSVKFERTTDIAKQKATDVEGEVAGGVSLKPSFKAMGKTKGQRTTRHTYSSKAVSEQFDDLIHYVPTGDGKFKWSILPELINSGVDGEPVKQVLDGVYLSGAERLLQFKRTSSSDSVTLVFGIRSSIANFSFDFEEDDDSDWWDVRFKGAGFKAKKPVAEELFREFLRKAINLPTGSNDDVFLGIAAAELDDF